MPPLIDTGWSFGRLILEVAEDAGLADQSGPVPAIPTDPATLDLVKRAVNKGYKEFLRLDPMWSFRRRAFTLTTSSDGTGPENVGNDAGVMRLPRWLTRAPDMDFRFIDENAPYGTLTPCTYADIRLRQQSTPMTGVPEMVAVHPLDQADAHTGPGSGGGWAAYFWPTPDSAYQLESGGFVLPYDLVELEERHIAGAEHDETIKAFALKHLHNSPHEDPGKKEATAQEADRQFLISKGIDAGARVGIKGRLRDPNICAPSRSPYPGDRGTFTAYGQVIGPA